MPQASRAPLSSSAGAVAPSTMDTKSKLDTLWKKGVGEMKNLASKADQAATRLANAVAVGRRRRRAPPERRRTRNNWRADAPGADEDAFEEERPLALPFEPEALEAERR